MKTLQDTMPAMHKEICQRMSPDELLEGENIPVVQGVTIVLKDAKRRPVLKQKKGFKQMLLTKYFKQKKGFMRANRTQ